MRAQLVYIASASVNALAARELAATLRAQGHVITSTWHDEDGIEVRRAEEHALSHAHRRAIAARCVSEVLSSTVLVVLAHPEMRGGLVEVGVAIGALIPVDWRGDDRSTLFAALCRDRVLDPTAEET